MIENRLAAAFYLRYGFAPILETLRPDTGQRLFLPMKTLQQMY
jgi:hypothetical protein